jgi:cell division protein FtsQ
MWDDVPLLRSIANTLTFFSVAALLYAGGYYIVHLPKVLPIKAVRLEAVPERLATKDINDLLQHELRNNFLTIDIDKLRLSLGKLPWVRNVGVKREFPNQLIVQFEEQKPLAHWNNVALVNQQGEVFMATTAELLPGFYGSEGTSKEVMVQYNEFSKQLSVLNLQIKRLILSPRHAWQLSLSNDMVIELGREDMTLRLARFVAVYPYIQAGATANEIQIVDMRYRDGFSIKKRHVVV